MGCGFSKFDATTDGHGDVGSSLRIKNMKPPLEKIVERSSRWRINEQHHRRDNSLSQKFLPENSEDLDDHIIQKANNDNEKVGCREEVDRHRHDHRHVDHVVRDNVAANNGRHDHPYGGNDTDEDDDDYSDRQDSITFQFQGSPSFKEYCIPSDYGDVNYGNYEGEGRREKKLEMSGKIVSTKSIKAQK